MARYLIVRLGLGLVTIAGVVLLTFVLQFSLPGDPARRIAGPRASPEVLATVRANLHLDDSVPSQLVTYMTDVAQGDLGVSYIRRRPVIDLVMERLPATAVLAFGGLLVEVTLGGGLGLWDGLRRNRSRGLAAANVVLLSIPTYSLGFLLLVVFAYRLDLLPLGGGTSAKELILPAMTLGLFGVPYYAAVVSESTRTALSSPYMRTAVAKGLPRRVILRRHVIRNCLSPVITLAGLDVAIYLSGVVFVESVFAWPGVGELQEQAYNELDRPVLMGTVIIAAVVVVAFNLVADVVRAIVDPRARVEEAGVTVLLEVDRVSVQYGSFEAVTEASLVLEEGRTMAIVGESGSGKTSLALAVARLLPPGGEIAGGAVRVDGVDVTGLTGAELRRARGRLVGYLAQDSMAALNPVLPAGLQVAEVFETRDGVKRREARRQAAELLAQVGIQRAGEVAGMYPHELSGGMRQRVMIAMALALRSRLLIADEPTTALDVTVQAEILALAAALQAEHGVTILWITHDMGVVAEIADTVGVMYGGRIVEQGPAAEVFANPAHPYTQALLETVRGGAEAPPKSPFATIAGAPPSGFIPPGCPFHPRCAHVHEPCPDIVPATVDVGPGHRAACHLLGAAR